jgi:hypothetical protein
MADGTTFAQRLALTGEILVRRASNGYIVEGYRGPNPPGVLDSAVFSSLDDMNRYLHQHWKLEDDPDG